MADRRPRADRRSSARRTPAPPAGRSSVALAALAVVLATAALLFWHTDGASAQTGIPVPTVAPPTTPIPPLVTVNPGGSFGGGTGTPTTIGPVGPTTTTTPGTPGTGTSATTPALSLDLLTGKASGQGAGPLQIVLLITAITVAPAILMLVTAFTRIVIVLGLTRNALSVQAVPPNQVLIGLALFLTIFVMSPVFSEANRDGIQPYMRNEITQDQAFTRTAAPFKKFMLQHAREKDVATFVDLSGKPAPASPDDLPLTTVIPAFVISELRAAFLIGFVVFIPFLIIDMITSATLTSMGMVMVQPATVALPFKLLLFVLVDGWSLLTSSLIRSFG